jgi:lipopolysaccharide export system permease protein
MIGRIFRPLDSYVLGEFWKIFVTTALGFPILVIVIDLTDKLETYLNRNLPRSQIALSYLYWLPDSMFMVLPAAVLFATVFSIGAFTRHSEITAAKASGISFHRFTMPVYVGAFVAMLLGLALAELVPVTTEKRLALLEDRRYQNDEDRFNFAYAAEHGRVYKISALNAAMGTMEGIEVERRGGGVDYPTYVLSAQTALWRRATERWMLRSGDVHVVAGRGVDFAVSFDSAYDRRLDDKPMDLLAKPRSPQEMGWRDLTRFIETLERSGGDANVLRVERSLKIAIPVTCVIIVLFGAPLATSTQRGGTAFGVGVSLGTTIIFLMLIQMTKAVGGKGLIPPDLAAWIPNAIFGVAGAIMLARVRT